MKKRFFCFLFFFIFVLFFQISAHSGELLRYIIPEGATEVAVVEVEEDRFFPGSDKIAIYRDFDDAKLPRPRKIVFYDKDGNVLEAKLKPPVIKHIKIDPKNIKIPAQ